MYLNLVGTMQHITNNPTEMEKITGKTNCVPVLPFPLTLCEYLTIWMLLKEYSLNVLLEIHFPTQNANKTFHINIQHVNSIMFQFCIQEFEQSTH